MRSRPGGRRSALLAVGLGFAGLGAVACTPFSKGASPLGPSTSALSGTAGPTPTTTVAVATRRLKIGFVGPLTGLEQDDGVSTRNAVRMALDHLIEDGATPGVRWELDGVDSAGKTPAAVARAVERMAGDDEMLMIFGSVPSSVQKRVNTALDEANVTWFDPFNGDLSLTRGADLARPVRPSAHVYRLTANTSQLAEGAARTLSRTELFPSEVRVLGRSAEDAALTAALDRILSSTAAAQTFAVPGLGLGNPVVGTLTVVAGEADHPIPLEVLQAPSEFVVLVAPRCPLPAPATPNETAETTQTTQTTETTVTVTTETTVTVAASSAPLPPVASGTVAGLFEGMRCASTSPSLGELPLRRVRAQAFSEDYAAAFESGPTPGPRAATVYDTLRLAASLLPKPTPAEGRVIDPHAARAALADGLPHAATEGVLGNLGWDGFGDLRSVWISLRVYRQGMWSSVRVDPYP